MRPDGVLTSVDLEAEHQRLARETFREAGIASQRYRLITGAALDVLPRLTDGAYDLVLCDAARASTPTTCVRRCVCCVPAGWSRWTTRCGTTRWRTQAQRDDETVALRELGPDDPRGRHPASSAASGGRRIARRPQG
jgi:hypothetical protein